MWLSESNMFSSDVAVGIQVHFLPVGQASGAWENASEPGHALGSPFRAKGIQLGEQVSSRGRGLRVEIMPGPCSSSLLTD